MLYFDVRRPLERLSKEQRGDLLTAILNFSEFGTEPNLDELTSICFEFIRPRLERDAKNYEEKVWKRKYAVQTREAEKRGEIMPPFDEWYEYEKEKENWL